MKLKGKDRTNTTRVSVDNELLKLTSGSGGVSKSKRLRLCSDATSSPRDSRDDSSSDVNSDDDMASSVSTERLNSSRRRGLDSSTTRNQRRDATLKKGTPRNRANKVVRSILRSDESDLETNEIDVAEIFHNACAEIKMTDNAIRNSIPPPIKLPLYLPTRNFHRNWAFCRVFSEEINTTFDKHMKKFEGEYLSRYLLGEIFHEKVSEEDSDFDPSIFFQAVEVTKINKIFAWSKDCKRLAIDCQEIPTANNIHLSDAEKKRKIVAEGSLAELLVSCCKEGDFLLIFGDILLEQSKLITLNSRYQHPVAIAHYRHDGVFEPPMEGSQDFEDFTRPFKKHHFVCTFEECEDSEVLIKVQPNVPDIESETMLWHSSSSQDIVQDRILPELGLRRIADSPSSSSKTKIPSVPLTPVRNPSSRMDASLQTSYDFSDESDLQIDIVKEIEENGILDGSGSSSSSASASQSTLRKDKSIRSENDLEENEKSDVPMDTSCVEDLTKRNTSSEGNSLDENHMDGLNASNGMDDTENPFADLQAGTQHHFVNGDSEEYKNHKDENTKPIPKVKDCSVRLERLIDSELRSQRSIHSIMLTPEALESNSTSRVISDKKKRPKPPKKT